MPAEPELPEISALVRGYGVQIRTLREHRRLSRCDLGAKVGFSGSTIGAFERGERIVDEPTATSLDGALGADGVLACVGPELTRQRYPRKFLRFFQLEAEAVSLNTYGVQTLHGLLQTEGYARATFTSRVPRRAEDEVERLVAERQGRKALFDRTPIPLLCFVLDEAILMRCTGGKQVMHEQLQHLLDLGRLSHVQILVLPLDCEEPVGSDGPLTMLETKDRRMLGYAEAQGEGMLVSDKDEVSTWRQRFEQIQAQARPPADSARLITRLMEEK